MNDAASAYLPGSGIAGTVCVVVAFIGMIVCLMGLLRPRTNAACVVALLIFFFAWMIECSAHLLVTYAHLPAEWRSRGIITAAVLFVAGLVTALIGLIGVSRNEHRYDHGFISGLLAVGGNGWVVGAAITAALQGQLHQLSRGLVIPIAPAGNALEQEALARAMGNGLFSDGSDPNAYETLMADLVGRVLSLDAGEQRGGWREIPLGDAQFVKAIDSEASRLFSTPTGPGWMSLFVEKKEGLTPEALEQQAATGLHRALEAATTSEITWRERLIAEGFEMCRAGYVANLPSLAGPHVFDRWLACGHGWRISIVQWTPSSPAAQDFRRRSDAIARTLLTGVVLRSSLQLRRSEDMESLLIEGRSAMRKQDLTAAVTSYRRAAEKTPRDPEIALLVATTLEQLRRPADALAFLLEKKAGLPASPVVEAAHLRLLAVLTPDDPVVRPGFQRLFDAGLRDDVTFAAWLALLDSRHDPAAGTVVLDTFGADHCHTVVAAWRKHFTQATTPAKTTISPAESAPNPPGPPPATPADEGANRKRNARP